MNRADESPTTRPHFNQPGGPARPSALAHIAGRERESRALADAVRRIIDATVRNAAPVADTAAFASRLNALADELDEFVPAVAATKYGAWDAATNDPHDHFQFDPMLGLYNPLALPVRMSWVPPKAIGHAHFPSAYEGPPGCVHGGVIAAVFDQVFNVANLKTGVAGPTGNLSIDYRTPTPIMNDIVFEAWVDRIDGRKVFAAGRLLHDEVVTAEAAGLFIRMNRG